MLVGDQQSALLIFDHTHDGITSDPVLPAILDDLLLNNLDQFTRDSEPKPPVTVCEGRHLKPDLAVRDDQLELEITVLARRRAVQSVIGSDPEVVVSVEEQSIDLIRLSRIAHAKIDELPPLAPR